MRNPFTGYQGQGTPLWAYGILVGAYHAAFGAIGAGLSRRRRPLPRPGPGDLALFGLATHKLARIVARDWVTSPLRAPFTRYVSDASGGEVNESSRGRGLQRAVGDLVSCPFCMGPWVAMGLMAGFALSPPRARLGAAVFAAVSISDFLHRVYDGLVERQEALQSRAESLQSRPAWSAQGEAKA